MNTNLDIFERSCKVHADSLRDFLSFHAWHGYCWKSGALDIYTTTTGSLSQCQVCGKTLTWDIRGQDEREAASVGIRDEVDTYAGCVMCVFLDKTVNCWVSVKDLISEFDCVSVDLKQTLVCTVYAASSIVDLTSLAKVGGWEDHPVLTF